MDAYAKTAKTAEEAAKAAAIAAELEVMADVRWVAHELSVIEHDACLFERLAMLIVFIWGSWFTVVLLVGYFAAKRVTRSLAMGDKLRMRATRRYLTCKNLGKTPYLSDRLIIFYGNVPAVREPLLAFADGLNMFEEQLPEVAADLVTFIREGGWEAS